MNNRLISRSLVCILIVAAIFASMAIVVNADSGNVKITLPPHDTLGSVSGVEFSVYKVGDVEETSDKPVFDVIYGIDKAPTTAAEILEDVNILKKADKPAPVTTGKTSSDGVLDLTLERGIYYIEADENDYGVIEPMLIWLPYFDEITQDMAYDIQLKPKAEPNGTVQGEEEFPEDETDGTVKGETSNPNSNGLVLGDEAKTSDTMNMILLAVVLIVVAILIIAIIARMRSKKE